LKINNLQKIFLLRTAWGAGTPVRRQNELAVCAALATRPQHLEVKPLIKQTVEYSFLFPLVQSHKIALKLQSKSKKVARSIMDHGVYTEVCLHSLQ